MTNSTTVDDEIVQGNYQVVFATVDITSLANANNEPWDPTANTSLDDYTSVAVGGIENPQTHVVQWDSDGEAFHVENYGGTDPTAGTDVGEVTVRVEGRR